LCAAALALAAPHAVTQAVITMKPEVASAAGTPAAVHASQPIPTASSTSTARVDIAPAQVSKFSAEYHMQII